MCHNFLRNKKCTTPLQNSNSILILPFQPFTLPQQPIGVSLHLCGKLSQEGAIIISYEVLKADFRSFGHFRIEIVYSNICGPKKTPSIEDVVIFLPLLMTIQEKHGYIF